MCPDIYMCLAKIIPLFSRSPNHIIRLLERDQWVQWDDIVTLWVWMTLDFYSSAAATFLLAVGTFLTDYPPWKELLIYWGQNIPLVTPHFRQFLWKMLSVVLLVHFSSVWCRVPLHHPVSSLNLLVPRLWQYCSIALYAFVLLFYCKGLYGVWLP